MGTVNFTVTGYAKAVGNLGAANVLSSNKRTSGVHTSSTSASFIEDGVGDITCQADEVFRMHASEAMWVNFGGTAAAVGTGFYVPADGILEIEVGTAGKVSAIDVA